jgi:hypothetical protein
MSHLDFTLSMLGFALQAALIIILFRQKAVGLYRIFLTFLVCSTISDLLYVWLRADTRLLYLLYWVIQAVNSAVALAVIVEIFRDAVQLVYSRLGAIGFFGPLAIFGLVDFLFWRKLHHGFSRDWLGVGTGLAVSMVLGIALLQAAIAVVCMWLRHRYGIFDRRSLAVLGGFGIIGASVVTAYILRAQFGRDLENVVRYIPFEGSMCAMLIWIVIFSLPEENRPRYDRERIERFLKLATRYVEDVRETMDRWGLRYSGI